MPTVAPETKHVSPSSHQCCFKLASPCDERGSMGGVDETLTNATDPKTIYVNCCNSLSDEKTVIMGSQRVDRASELFYTPVSISGRCSLTGMLDTGSMSCTLSEEADCKLRAAGVALNPQHVPENVVLVGCGGLITQPKCIYDLDIEVYGTRFLVPTFVVPGQKDELIVGSNVIRPIIQKMKADTKYWELINSNYTGTDCEDFLQLLSCISRWSAPVMPDKVGTVRLRKSVTLLPQKEYVVWGKLPPSALVSPGSTVVVEPTSARSTPKNIMVGRIITPMWGDRWVPMKVLNPTQSPVTLRRNAKIADVFPCIAVEDLPITQGLCETLTDQHTSLPPSSDPVPDSVQLLKDAGLADIDIEGCEVSDGWKRKLVELVLTYQDVFSRDKLDCGEVKDFVHRIHLTDDHPFRLPYRRVPPAHYHKLCEVLSEMEMKGIIGKSTSEYASPLVMVWKKSGDLRICTDFRWLNAKTVKDAHPLLHQADCLAALGGNAFFSTMDLTSGFYNVPLHESDRRYTAFTTPLGLYEYNRLPQGLCNSPASFMRMMLSIFGDLNFSSLLCYLDDLLVFAPSEEEALKRIEIVFSRLRTSNLKLAQKKCHFLRRSVRFLGHVVDAGGVSVDQDKVRVITSFQKTDLMDGDGCTPSQRKVRSFLGMVMFYQHFIPGCSRVAKPLFALTAGQKRTKGCHGSRKPGTFRKLTPQDWTPACEKAFEELKGALLSCAVLAHPDFERPFILSTDASMDGLGAVLSQVPAGEERARPIAFASKSLSRSQAKYPAHRLEFLALKWAVCDKFSHWLKGHQFTVWTDNNPLTYILTKPKLDACEQRWVSKLAPYCFEIKYVPGKLNIVADTLSREPFVRPLAQRLLSEPYFELLEQVSDVRDASVQDAFRLTCQPQSVHSAPPSAVLDVSLSTDDVSSLMSSLCEWESASRQRATSLAGHLTSISPPDCDVSHVLSHTDLLSHQTGDPVISRVARYVERKRRPSRRERYHENQHTLRLLKQWDKLTFLNGVLYRVVRDPLTKHKRFQFVVPDSLKQMVLSGIHDNAGHQGQPRTLSLARQRFFWYDMEKDVRNHVRSCRRCVLSKTPEPAARAPLESIKTCAPLELVCIDFWSAEDSNNKSVDVLVITDHFTKLAHAFQCQDQTAKRVAKKLWDGFFCVYGFPQRIHSDQGASFESELLAELLVLGGVAKSLTSPYHPMGNGTTERFNRTLGNMLRSLPPRSKQKWPQMIQSMTFVYNCTAHETTGFAPFYLMFGRVPRLPVDLMFRDVLHDDTICDYDTYVKSLMNDLRSAMLQAQEHSTMEQRHQSDQYNRKVKGLPLSLGDQVLLANKGVRGKRKLSDKWEPVVYTVVDLDPALHICRIRDREGHERVVHRNLLLQVNFLPLDTTLNDDAAHPAVSVVSGSPESDLDGSVTSFGDTGAVPPATRTVASVSSIGERDDRTLSWIHQQSAADPVEDGVHETPPIMDVPDLGGLAGDGASPDSPAAFPSHSFHSLEPENVDVDQGLNTRFGRIIKPVRRLIESMAQLETLLGVEPVQAAVIDV
uniref:Gypsy retrotransposon integrase-like protein 1 n=1 Tax=Oreochromis niloticus TaxID=8128 RepID=A0A669EIA0_ORENI